MEIHRARLPKRHLASLPLADWTLFLLLGHVSNEINVLQKLMLMLRRNDPPSRLVDIVEAGEVMIIMRNLIGKLHEAYRVFNEQVQGDEAIRERYGIRGEWSGRELLKDLNARFKRGSLLTRIRQKISSHYVDEDGLLEVGFQALSEDEPWELYLSDTVANSFYYASELVVMKAVLNLVDAEPVPEETLDQTKLNKLFIETLTVADIIMKLSHTLMIEIIEKSGSDGLVMEPVEVGEVRKVSEVHLPFFVDEDDLRAGRTGS